MFKSIFQLWRQKNAISITYPIYNTVYDANYVFFLLAFLTCFS